MNELLILLLLRLTGLTQACRCTLACNCCCGHQSLAYGFPFPVFLCTFPSISFSPSLYHTHHTLTHFRVHASSRRKSGYKNVSCFLSDSKIYFFFHVSYNDASRLAHFAGLETLIGSVFRKGFYCSISFGNVYIGYTYCC